MTYSFSGVICVVYGLYIPDQSVKYGVSGLVGWCRVRAGNTWVVSYCTCCQHSLAALPPVTMLAVCLTDAATIITRVLQLYRRLHQAQVYMALPLHLPFACVVAVESLTAWNSPTFCLPCAIAALLRHHAMSTVQTYLVSSACVTTASVCVDAEVTAWNCCRACRRHASIGLSEEMKVLQMAHLA